MSSYINIIITKNMSGEKFNKSSRFFARLKNYNFTFVRAIHESPPTLTLFHFIFYPEDVGPKDLLFKFYKPLISHPRWDMVISKLKNINSVYHL
ncbi:MAG TPA: hypothetical protein DEA57_00985 [Sulfurihydrogenibium sp.]|nr:hypothetical protein [Sulfurihydrogenibium sp.]